MVHFAIMSLERDYHTKLLPLPTIAADNIVKVEDIVDIRTEGLVVPTVELPHSIPALIAVWRHKIMLVYIYCMAYQQSSFTAYLKNSIPVMAKA